MSSFVCFTKMASLELRGQCVCKCHSQSIAVPLRVSEPYGVVVLLVRSRKVQAFQVLVCLKVLCANRIGPLEEGSSTLIASVLESTVRKSYWCARGRFKHFECWTASVFESASVLENVVMKSFSFH